MNDIFRGSGERYSVLDRHTGAALWVAGKSLRASYLGFRVPCDLRSANFRGLDLGEADFTGRDLSDADLTGTQLQGARYDNRTVWPAGFDPARQGAVRVPVDMSGAQLANADLSGSDFADGNLQGAVLTGANLQNTLLTRAKLRGAQLVGADFTGADLDGADVAAIRFDDTTRWPDGFDPASAARPTSPPTLETTLVLLKSLADPTRLRLLGLLAREEATVEELADALELSEPTVSHHLTRLKEQQLVTVRADGARRLHRLDEGRLTAQLDGLPRQILEVAKADVDPGAFEKKVLETFFDGDRLREIPARYKKQRIVLGRIVQRFEPGRQYTEREVSESLRQVHPDFASLRRYLIDHKLMARENNRYWRL